MKGKLRIGIIGTRGIPNRYGGFEAFAEQVSGRLARRGHHVTVYCPQSQQYRENSLNGAHLVFRRDPGAFAGTAGQFIYDLACNLHAGKQSFDVILHLGYTSDAAWSWLWSGKARHVTNMDGMEWARAKYVPAVRSYLEKAETWAARRSVLLVADSKHMREYLESKYATPVRFISYGAGIPVSFNREAPAEYGAAAFLYDLVIARMEPENNIEMAVEAKLAENSTVPLLIFSNETKHGSRLKNKYRHERLIRFQQACYQPGVLDSLRHFSRYYIHGHSAGGTNPSLLEAMACGCRILSHDNPFNREVLTDNAGFYPDGTSLSDLLNQPWTLEKFQRQTENNLRIIRENHNWEFITDEYEQALGQALV